MAVTIDVWVETVAYAGGDVAIAEGFDADGDDVMFTAEPVQAHTMEQAIEEAQGPVLTAVPESALVSRVRLALDADAMVVPRHLFPRGHWFG
jgi:hypothetical protein